MIRLAGGRRRRRAEGVHDLESPYFGFGKKKGASQLLFSNAIPVYRSPSTLASLSEIFAIRFKTS